MTRKPRRLHSVPTGADVDATGPVPAQTEWPAATPPPVPLGLGAPTAVPGWPFPLVDLSSLTPDDVATLMDRIGKFSQDGRFQNSQQRVPTPSRRRPRRRHPVTLRVRIDLEGITPPIWRRVDLSSDLTLDQLHAILQCVFGWLDMHLHSFLRGDSRHDRTAERYLTSFDVSEGDEGVLESAVQLDELFVDPGDKLFYTYDFGDNWEHTLVLESVQARPAGGPVVRCVDGRRTGPPEDCGGIWGYQELLERGELHDDPGVFDPAQINRDLLDRDPAGATPAGIDTGPLRDLTAEAAARLPAPLLELLHRSSGPAGAVLPDLLSRIDFSSSISLPPTTAAELTHRYSWLLQRVGSNGLPMTAAGYLKPADVAAAFTELALGEEWIGSGNREVHSLPVLTLRESAQRLGLVRKFKGRLLQTKAGASVADDPVALLDWIASRLPLGKSPQELDAGLGLLTVVAALATQDGASPRRSIDQCVADMLVGVGWRDLDGRPISATMANVTADHTETVLRQLGVLQWRLRFAGPSVTAEGAEFARLALTR